MKKITTVLIIIVLAIVGIVILKNSSVTASFIWDLSNKGAWLLPLVLISALLDSVHPCSFSILLITFASFQYPALYGEIRCNSFNCVWNYKSGKLSFSKISNQIQNSISFSYGNGKANGKSFFSSIFWLGSVGWYLSISMYGWSISYGNWIIA